MRAKKLHMNDDQLDGHMYAWCGRGDTAATDLEFEAADPATRCMYCDREYFPRGQPDWHRKGAIEALKESKK